MKIRTASLSDAHAIAEIHVSGWRSAYRDLVPQAHLDGLSATKREAIWASAIETGQSKILVAESRAGLIGWIAFGRCRDSDKPEHTGEIWAIYVAPEQLGKGVGRDLWLRACADLRNDGYREVTLWVLAQNERACQFYVKAGFAPEVESAKTAEIGGAKLQELRYARSIASQMKRPNLLRGVYVACGLVLCIAIGFVASAVIGYDGLCGGFFPGLSVRKPCSLWGYMSGDMFVIAMILMLNLWPVVLALLVLPPFVGYWFDRKAMRHAA